MRLQDPENLDPVYEEIVVLFNARPEPVEFADPAFAGKGYTLNSVQQVSVDSLARESKFDSSTGAFTVPGRTTAVFNILHAPEVEPTSTVAVEAEAPAAAHNDMVLILAGVVGGLLAVGALMLALRRRENR